MFDVVTSVFAICFLVGLALTMVALLGGIGHFAGHGTGHVGLDHLHVGDGHSSVTAHTGANHTASSDSGEGVSFLNLSSLTIFLTWFGAAGLCLHLATLLGLGIILALASLGGLAGAYLVYLFLVRFLLKGQSRPLSTTDTYMPGTVAKVSSTIAPGGTGEIIYVHLGTRRSCGARAVNGELIPKATQVVILKYEKGIAYVKPSIELQDITY